jgi:acyl-CoA thioesterase
MNFSTILDALSTAKGACVATVPATWLQGRSVFGGLQAALAVRAMRSLVPSDAVLRVLQTTFVAPVPAGDVRVRARLLRTGKSAVQVEARLLDGDETGAIAVGVFGSSRASRVRVVPEQPPVDAGQAFELPFTAGLSPEFLQHFAVRWLMGGLPFSGMSSPRAVAEIGMPGEEQTTAEHVLALADVPPPVALSHLDERAPGSSLTWTVEFLEPAAHVPPRGFRADAELIAARDGYTSQSVMLWGPSGEPVALSRQCMVVFG